MPAKNIYVSDSELWDALIAQAEREHLSVSQLIAKAVRAYLETA